MTEPKRATGRARTAAKLAAETPAPAVGLPMTAAITALVDGLDLGDDKRRLALAQLAKTLAGQLDDGVGMATAAVSKELRATLAELEGEDAGDDDDSFSQWEHQLGSPA